MNLWRQPEGIVSALLLVWHWPAGTSRKYTPLWHGHYHLSVMLTRKLGDHSQKGHILPSLSAPVWHIIQYSVTVSSHQTASRPTGAHCFITLISQLSIDLFETSAVSREKKHFYALHQRPVLFCTLSSVVVVCNAAGVRAGRWARGNAAWERCWRSGRPAAGRVDGPAADNARRASTVTSR